MKVALLGGTRGMGRALARLCAERGARIALLGRRAEELERSAADLRARAATGQVVAVPCDLENPSSFEPALKQSREALGDVDTVIVSAALFARQEELEKDLELARRLLMVNFTNTILFCEHARRLLLERGGGTLCVFSSVAGERGRKPVAIYGSTKAGLSRYLEALDHRYHGEGLRVVCVKPGFVKTGMTAGLKPPPFSGEPDDVARRVLRAIDRGTPVVYAPATWSLVMLVIRALPRFVMRRLNF